MRPGRLSVDALDAFPCLAETRLTATPLVDLNPQTRHEVVARVSRLTMLNGSLVGRAERRDAEIRYLRRALDEAAGAADAPAATRHPRMTQLLVRRPCAPPALPALADAPPPYSLSSGSWRRAAAAAAAASPWAARAWLTTCLR